jgi:SAM-dependent methyltransferase
MNPYVDFLKDLTPLLGDYKDKTIMDVGCEMQGNLIRCLTEDFHAASAIGLNPMAPNKRLSPSCQIVQGDIRKTAFAEEHFDLILSSCAFEHIPNLDLALDEMHRILKPGGFVYSHHGPLWSTCYGHHLWLPGNNTYWKIVLPPWCHLLMREGELAAWLADKYHPDAIKPILDWVYRDTGQNRLMFTDHLKLYENSPFEVCFCHGYLAPELAKLYRPLITYEHIRDLKSLFPHHDGFFYDGIKVLLRKRP